MKAITPLSHAGMGGTALGFGMLTELGLARARRYPAREGQEMAVVKA